MLMDKKKRFFITMTFIFCVAGIALISVSLATEYWIESKPVKMRSGKNEGNGTLHFGLFHGGKEFNSGLGTKGREKEIWITDQATAASNVGLLNFGLWVCTIVFAGLGIVWALVGSFLAIINLATRPIETITGPTGLYVWNTLACLFTLLSVIMFTVLYYVDLKTNVLTEDEQNKFWTSAGHTYFGYSFWLLVGASGCFAINIIFVMLAGAHFRPVSYKASMTDKNIDGIMMY